MENVQKPLFIVQFGIFVCRLKSDACKQVYSSKFDFSFRPQNRYNKFCYNFDIFCTLIIWSPGKSSSATAATTFATRALRGESEPPLFSVSSFPSFSLSTSDDTAWPLCSVKKNNENKKIRIFRIFKNNIATLSRLRLNSQLDWSNCASRKTRSWSFVHTLPY